MLSRPCYGAGFTMVLESNVTAAIRASALPFSVAPVFSVMAWSAMIVPWKADVVPRVAEVPTCQKTLLDLALPLRMT